jgi:ABC-type branched-subunit amino acid transport system substrate-binding protein
MPKKLYRLLAGLLLSLSAPAVLAVTGVTANTIVLGQSAAMTGPAKMLGTEMRAGAMAYFDFVNANGGVDGRKIVLKTLDDGYEPARAEKNTRELIEKEKVFALFGYVGTATSLASLPLVKQEDLPFFAPVSGAESLREPFNRNVFNIRASYYSETEKIVENLQAMGSKRIAVFYQDDAFGKAGLEGVTRAMKRRKMDLVGTATVERNSVNVTAAVAALQAMKPRAIISISTAEASAAMTRAMSTNPEDKPYFWNISFVGGHALSVNLGAAGRGVMISQVVPAPWDDKMAMVREYKRLYLSTPGREAGFISLEGFIAAKTMVEGMKRASGGLTRASFIKSMEAMKSYDLGGFAVHFGPDDHTGSDFIDLTVISAGGNFIY